MGKRPGENLARTIDGAQYNKLQRPDNFPTAPARPIVSPGQEKEHTVELDKLQFDKEDREQDVPEEYQSFEEDEEPEVVELPESRSQKGRWKAKKAQLNSTTGQYGALPLPEFHVSDDSLEAETSRQAMEYLMSVRDEASKVPYLLVAPKSPLSEDDEGISLHPNGEGYFQGFSQDHAYVAPPTIGPVLPDVVRKVSAQQAYSIRLITSFHALRARLQRTPSREANPSSILHQSLSVRGIAEGLAARKWTRCSMFDPIPAQIRMLDEVSAARLLRCATRDLKRNKNLPERLGSWIWALLARLDQGLIEPWQAGIVRDLAKKAIWMRLGFDHELAEHTEAMAEGLDDDAHNASGGGAEDEMDALEDCEVENDGVMNANVRDRDREGDKMEGGEIEEGEVSDSEGGRGRLGSSEEMGSRRRNTSSPSPRGKKSERHIRQLRTSSPGLSGASVLHMHTNDESKTFTNGASESDQDVAAAKARLLGRIAEVSSAKDKDLVISSEQPNSAKEEKETKDTEMPSLNTRATLDMIITIVGEIFGQKDLLEFQEIWE